VSRPFSFYVCRALWRQLARLHLAGLPRIHRLTPRFYAHQADVRVSRHGWSFTVGTNERQDPRYCVFRYRPIVHIQWARPGPFRVLWYPRGAAARHYWVLSTPSARRALDAVRVTLLARV